MYLATIMVDMEEERTVTHSRGSRVHGNPGSPEASQRGKSDVSIPRARSVARIFEGLASRHPPKVAVRLGSRSLSYGDLDALANRAARLIVEIDGVENRPVAALLSESLHVPVAALAILKAGKGYVPLNAVFPEPRLAAMLEDCDPPLVVTDASHAGLASRLAGPSRRIVNLDGIPDSLSSAPLDLDPRPDALGCLLYTSGSTGKPKGVINTFEQLYHTLMMCRGRLGLAGSDTLATFASFAFAGGFRNCFWTLLSGGTHYTGVLEEVDRIPDILAREEVTVLSVSPSVLAHFLDSYRGAPLPALRLVNLSAEPLPRRLAERYFAAFPAGPPLVNGLGLTEGSVVASMRMERMPDFDGGFVPVGYAEDCAELLILDAEARPVAPGETGQIAVRGPNVASGYWNRPDLTAERFLLDCATGVRTYLTGDLGRMSADGCLTHLGRKDNLVKIRAHAVEVVEVESALRMHPRVSDAAVAAREDASGEQRLVGYIVPAGEAPSVGDLRSFLSRSLPDYMAPSAYMLLDRLPVTPNGKLDRAALPDPGRVRPHLDAPLVEPRTPVEKILARIWTEALGIDTVGVKDDFFELGGHSLAAARMVSLVRDEFSINIGLEMLSSARTIESVALEVTRTLLETRDPDSPDDPLADVERGQPGGARD